ncbi:RraA family protein [Streptomyces adelaidensis]|uniref:RraA family protein n=1 Tax=Streptomyces adelaidensis TaxID=2796465 RepID=UPI0019082982|nr:RraA family protein [Streptomyces adelaidensis]
MTSTTAPPADSRVARIRETFRELGCAQLRDAAPDYVEVLAWPLVSRTPGLHLAGPVYPVATANDMLPVLQALDAAAPGDVLLATNTAEYSEALAGDVLSTAAVAQGLGGLVVHGAVRDLGFIAELGLPVFSTEVNIISAKTAQVPAAELPMSVTVPVVGADGPRPLELSPGDWLFGDDDAVVAVRADRVSPVLNAARLLRSQEEKLRDAVRGGIRLSEACGLHDYLAGRGPLKMDV